MASLRNFGRNMASLWNSDHNMAFGQAFGHNMAFGSACGHYMAFGPAFGHNAAFGLAFGHSKLIKLIGCIVLGISYIGLSVSFIGGFVGCVDLSLVSLSRHISDINLISLSFVSSTCQIINFIGLGIEGLNSKNGFIGFGLVGFIGLGLGSLVNGFSLIGLSGPSDIMGLISLGHINLVGLGCFSGLLACARKKMWFSNNNDALQDCFASVVLTAAARTIFQQCMQAAHGVAMASSATKIINAAIWYYCVAFDWFVRESLLCDVLLHIDRLDSVFGNKLQNATQLFLNRILQMSEFCIMRECENIHSWIFLSGDLVFRHQQGIYGFKFPKRFLEISSRDLTLFSILII
jgi:hypothetical protein